MNRIRVIVSGGNIQDIQNIPAGIIVEVFDYDCELEDTDEVDSIGDPVVKSEWFPESKRSKRA